MLKQICFRHFRVQIYYCVFRQTRTVDVESAQFIYATKKGMLFTAQQHYVRMFYIEFHLSRQVPL
jgi:hypothetical protein